MQIFPNLISSNNIPKQNYTKQKQTLTTKNLNFSQNVLQAANNYNLAFCGLFFERPIDARNNENDVKMEPGVKYLISDNAKFDLGGCFVLDLKNAEICEQIKKLGPGGKLVFGREAYSIKGMNRHISRRHLEISRNLEGRLIAKDLNSTNGTTILQDQMKDAKKTKFQKLPPNQETIIPNDCQLILGTDMVIDLRNPNITDLLQKKGSIIIGRDDRCDIAVDEFHDETSRRHLILSDKNGTITATDLNSTNGTFVVPKDKVMPFYKGAKNIELSQANVGDCYLLSTIYAMSKTDRGARMLEDIVSVDEYGNYLVDFKGGISYLITPEELDGQTSQNGTRKKYSVSGELGIKAIERAFAKDIKSKKEALTMFADIDLGGRTAFAMYKLTGLPTKTHSVAKNSVSKYFTEIKNDGMNNHIVTCSTSHRGKYGEYADKQRRFITGHAYTICDIDTKNELVTIANPHNTRNKQVVSWDEFSEIFDFFYDAKI